MRDWNPGLHLRRAAFFVVDLQPLAQFFQTKTKSAAAHNQSHARHFARAVKAGATNPLGLQKLNVFIIAQSARGHIEMRAHVFEC